MRATSALPCTGRIAQSVRALDNAAQNTPDNTVWDNSPRTTGPGPLYVGVWVWVWVWVWVGAQNRAQGPRPRAPSRSGPCVPPCPCAPVWACCACTCTVQRCSVRGCAVCAMYKLHVAMYKLYCAAVYARAGTGTLSSCRHLVVQGPGVWVLVRV